MAEDGYPVKLHVYDLSQGMARQLSTQILGKAIEGIWHTGLVVYGNEYFFGGGVQQDTPGRTVYGTPLQVVDLGVTHIPKEVFDEYLAEIRPRFTAETYNLLQHNCNNFSNEIAQFLVGSTIPSYILDLPREVMNSPMGAFLVPVIENLERTMRSGSVPQQPQFTPAAATSIIPPPAYTARSFPSQAAQVSSNGPSIPNGTAHAVPPAVQPVQASAPKKAQAPDALSEAQKRVKEEVKAEFDAIMATGTMNASEAAALAMRRVRERHQWRNVASCT